MAEFTEAEPVEATEAEAAAAAQPSDPPKAPKTYITNDQILYLSHIKSS